MVNADLSFKTIKCSKDGSVEFGITSEENKIATKDIGIIAREKGSFDIIVSKFGLEGNWSSGYITNGIITFKSRDAQINKAGNYEIALNYAEEGLNKNVVINTECPGLIFSCSLIKVDIKNCTSVDNKYFNLVTELAGLNQSVVSQFEMFEDIEYGVVAENSYEDIKGLNSNKGSLPEGMKIQKTDKEVYLFSKEFANNTIKSVNIYFKGVEGACKGENLYSFMECSNIHTETEPEKNETNPVSENKTILDMQNKTLQNRSAQDEIIQDVQDGNHKITGETIKIVEGNHGKKYWIYAILAGILVVGVIIIVIIKKQKVNKWV